METDPTEDPTEYSLSDERHPSLAELKDPSQPHIARHLEGCAMCRSVVIADDSLDTPIPLDLPKGLVSENAFRWPVEPLAPGWMAQIFLGEDRRLPRKVILKVPREGDDLPAGATELYQRRIIAEARILAKLQHPSIVKIYELGKASVGWPFCVLEMVEGVSLSELLDEFAQTEQSNGRPRTRERLELLSNVVAIGEALAHAHERRVVHRNCTPNNILLGKRGEATLLGWGIARDLDAPESPGEASQTSCGVGTPPYLSYEQTQGRAADPSFDVYSFGITLYEIVSGKTPFEWRVTSNPGERMRQLDRFVTWLRRGEPAPPAMPHDPDLSGIIARAMAHDPVKRFTADELVRALKQYLTAEHDAHRADAEAFVARKAQTTRPQAEPPLRSALMEAQRHRDVARVARQSPAGVAQPSGSPYQGKIDFGILTIRPDENVAVLRRFARITTDEQRRRYRIRSLELPDGSAYTLAVLRCLEQGTTDAQAAAHALLEELAPRFLLVVGIAGGVPSYEFSLGDVVVSSRIADFSVEAVIRDKSHEYALSGGPLHQDAAKLAADIVAMIADGDLDGWNSPDAIMRDQPPVDLTEDRFYGDDEWKKKVRQRIGRRFAGATCRPPRAITGVLASSDRLIKDDETMSVWLKIARQIQAVEMESAGIYKATHERGVPFLAIRGISDVVGFERDPDWTAYACETAAAFTRAFLLARPVAPIARP